MRLYLKTIPWLLVSCVLASGCSGDDNNNNNNNTSGGGNELTLDEYLNKISEAVCKTGVDCHSYETVAACVEVVKDEQIPGWVDNGTVKYHPEKADACLETYTQLLTCSLSQIFGDLTEQLDAKCAPVFEGLVAEGGECFNNQQCASTKCQSNDPNCFEACCPGKCAPAVPRPKIGEACPEGLCESGAYCQFNGMTCAAKGKEGQPCDSFDGCTSGYLCELDFMTFTGTCKKPSMRGEACDPMSDVACDRTDDFCDSTTKVCTLKKLPGEACTLPTDCVAYAKCDSATMKCVKLGSEGAACVDNFDCEGALTCEASKCTAAASVICQ